MPATAPPTRPGSGACTTTAWCISRSTARARGLLVQNNEYTDDGLLFPDGIANWNAEKTNKSINAHGVSIIEIASERGRASRGAALAKIGEWRVVRPSQYARRITGQTPIAHRRPGRRDDPRLKTSARSRPASACSAR